VIQFDTAVLQGGKGSGLGLFSKLSLLCLILHLPLTYSVSPSLFLTPSLSLSLSLCHSVSSAIVEQHGGKIGVSSTGVRGEGSIFFIELPACAIYQTVPFSDSGQVVTESRAHFSLVTPAFLEDLEQDSLPAEPIKFCSPRPGKFSCAMVVDDSKMNRKMLTQALNPYFDTILQVRCCWPLSFSLSALSLPGDHLTSPPQAEDGQQSLDLYSESSRDSTKISIIFMDSSMPVMTGIEATRLLRQTGYTGPIVGVTGNIMQEDVDLFLSAGANEVIGKPLKLEKLQEIISGRASPRLASPRLATFYLP
jgi:CheY-like chemotaxis protein